MPVDKVVLNASPLILLCNSELAFILPKLFTEIVVPEAVWQEIVGGPHVDQATKAELAQKRKRQSCAGCHPVGSGDRGNKSS